MSTDEPNATKAITEALIREAEAGDDSHPGMPASLKTLATAVEHDIDALVEAVTQGAEASAKIEADQQERLGQLEHQSKVLAEAVIALTNTDPALAPAVQAVKSGMPRGGPVNKPDSPR